MTDTATDLRAFVVAELTLPAARDLNWHNRFLGALQIVQLRHINCQDSGNRAGGSRLAARVCCSSHQACHVHPMNHVQAAGQMTTHLELAPESYVYYSQSRQDKQHLLTCGRVDA